MRLKPISALLTLTIVGLMASSSTAMTMYPKNSTGRINSSIDGLENSVNVKFKESNSTLYYNGNVTLRNGCEYIKSTTVEPVFYFATPEKDEPFNQLKVVIGANTDMMCTQALKTVKFNGKFSPTYFDSTLPIKNQLQFNVVYPNGQTQWHSNVNWKKVKWNTEYQESIKKNGQTFRLKGEVLDLKTRTWQGNCTGIRFGMIGPYCKFVEASATKTSPLKKIINLPELRKQFGPIQNLKELSFVAASTSGNGFGLGFAIVRGNYVARVQNECTNYISYYSIDPKTYKATQLLTRIEEDMPAMCE